MSYYRSGVELFRYDGETSLVAENSHKIADFSGTADTPTLDDTKAPIAQTVRAPPPLLLTREQLAEFLSLSDRTIKRLTARGRKGEEDER
jgi:hypothetical protein